MNTKFKVALFVLMIFGINQGFSQSKKELIKTVAELKVKMAALEEAKTTISNKLKTMENKQSIDLENENHKMSYAIGMNIAQSMVKQGIIDSVKVAALATALEDAKTGNFKISEQEANSTLQTYFQALQAKADAAAKEANKIHVEKNEQFLMENAKKEGIVTLASGLQYLILKEGDGVKPTAKSRVTTHYHGTLIDGTVFDSSVQRGTPITFGVDGVIKGWTEALQLMPVGSKWRLFIPQHIGDGAQGSGAKIPPYTTLIFEVEVIAIDGK